MDKQQDKNKQQQTNTQNEKIQNKIYKIGKDKNVYVPNIIKEPNVIEFSRWKIYTNSVLCASPFRSLSIISRSFDSFSSNRSPSLEVPQLFLIVVITKYDLVDYILWWLAVVIWEQTKNYVDWRW